MGVLETRAQSAQRWQSPPTMQPSSLMQLPGAPQFAQRRKTADLETFQRLHDTQTVPESALREQRPGGTPPHPESKAIVLQSSTLAYSVCVSVRYFPSPVQIRQCNASQPRFGRSRCALGRDTLSNSGKWLLELGITLATTGCSDRQSRSIVCVVGGGDSASQLATGSLPKQPIAGNG